MDTCLCPEEHALHAYVVGDLPPEGREAIDAHLEDCAACLERLDQVDRAANSMFSLLGHGAGHGADSTFQQRDSVLEQLVESAKHLSAESSATPEPAPGRILGSYRLLEAIGAGGMGRVYKAEHLRMKRQVALKVMAPEAVPSPEARARFQREAEAAAKVKSPHIVAAYDAGECDGHAFLVMELVEGRTLAEVVAADGPLSVRQALDCAVQAARGLEHAHAAGIIHRDVKPANLLVDAAGHVKLLDLGLARVAPTSERSPHAPREGNADTPRQADPHAKREGCSNLTGPTTIMGTAAYMAPEQAVATGQADARADIYSLGCTLYFLLTGQQPYLGQSPLEIVQAHREQPTPPVGARRPDCPREVDALCRDLMAKRAADRPASMGEVRARLERMVRGVPDVGRRAELARKPKYLKPLFAAGMAAGILVAVGYLALFGVPGQDSGSKKDEPSASAKAPSGTPVSSGGKKPVLEMVRLNPGEFWMGSSDTDRDAAENEKPRHKVKITQAFLLGKTKITQAQFESVMGTNPSAFSTKGRFKERVKSKDTAQHPVESVSWLDAVTFCNRLSELHELEPYYRIKGEDVTIRGGNGYRLPTEAEWEFACRAETTTRWHFGESAADLGEHAWFAANSDDITHPVGLKKPNAWGLYDMLGNVPEWCWDRFDKEYYKRSTVSDPPGSGTGSTRVHRGGAWNNSAAETRSAARDTLGALYDHLNPIGLRVARTLPE